MTKLLISFSAILLTVWSACAMDPVQFIVERNPDLKLLRKFNESALSRLNVKFQSNTGYGHSDWAEGWAYDVKIVAEMPIFSPREALDMRMKEFRLRRTIRKEAAQAVARYKGLRRYIQREEAIVAGLEAECKWLEKRVEAGLEPQKSLMNCVMNLRERIKNLEVKKEELNDALEAVLSYVGPEHRPELRTLLER